MTAIEGPVPEPGQSILPTTQVDDQTLRLFTGPDGHVPEWLALAWAETRKWLTLDYVDPGEYGPDRRGTDPTELPALPHHTTRNYAIDLGLPRALQTWRPPPDTRGRKSPGPNPQSWLRYCAVFGINPFTDVTEYTIEAWLRYARACGDARTTLRRRTGSLGAWYRRMRRQHLTTIVFEDVLPPDTRRRQELTIQEPVDPSTPARMDQVRALHVAAFLDPGAHAERNRVIVALLPTTGLRGQELCGLDLRNLHRKGPGGVPGIYVHGKGGRPKWVEIPPHAFTLIKAYLKVRVAPDTGHEIAPRGVVGNRAPVAQPLLTSHTGQRLTTTTIRTILKYLCGVLDPHDVRPMVAEAAAVLAEEGVRPHPFRHFQAQTAEQMGATWTQIAKTLGHRTTQTTKTYLESGQHLRDSTSSLVEDAIHADWSLAELDEPEPSGSDTTSPAPSDETDTTGT